MQIFVQFHEKSEICSFIDIFFIFYLSRKQEKKVGKWADTQKNQYLSHFFCPLLKIKVGRDFTAKSDLFSYSQARFCPRF